MKSRAGSPRHATWSGFLGDWLMASSDRARHGYWPACFNRGAGTSEPSGGLRSAACHPARLAAQNVPNHNGFTPRRHRAMRRPLLAATVLAVTLASAHAQTLRIALRQDLDVLDPTLATTYVGRIVFAGLCDKLFDIDEKLNIVPQLATDYTWADDRTLVIHLRSGVKFHNGEILDAAAVKYSLERHLTMQGSFRKSEISAIDHVELVDPATVRIVLKVPS